MSRQDVQNPWGLTCAEVDVLDELCRAGYQAAVAEQLGTTIYTVRDQLESARRKMQIPILTGGASLLMAVKWAIWRNTDGKGIPC